MEDHKAKFGSNEISVKQNIIRWNSVYFPLIFIVWKLQTFISIFLFSFRFSAYNFDILKEHWTKDILEMNVESY